MWYDVFEAVARISIITNIALACIYSDQIDGWVSSDVWKALVFIITEVRSPILIIFD
jgi:hypothetical protein